YDAAEGADRVALLGLKEGPHEALVRRHAAGVIVLHYDARRFGEVLDRLERGVRVINIVERELLSLYLLRIGNARLLEARHDIERAFLVRVLAVSQLHLLFEVERH